MINNRRGRIQVLDRRALESRACECYEVVKRECDRLVPAPECELRSTETMLRTA